jgi:hypothetical protein
MTIIFLNIKNIFSDIVAMVGNAFQMNKHLDKNQPGLSTA